MALDILFQCYWGSTLYGTRVEGSDRDYLSVCLPNKLDMLMGKPLQIKSMGAKRNRKVRNNQMDVDDGSIPVQIFAKDFFLGKPYALEVAFAQGAYWGVLWQSFIRELREFLNSDMKVLGVARSRFAGYRLDYARGVGVTDWKDVMHSARLLLMAYQVMRNEYLSFPLREEQVSFLLAIRNGEKSMGSILEWGDMVLSHIDKMKGGGLPTREDKIIEFNQFLSKWVSLFYHDFDKRIAGYA